MAKSTIPTINDPEWSDYVLSLMSDDEKESNEKQTFPKISGLRRLTNVLVGDIIRSQVTQVIPERDKCTIVYEIQVGNAVYSEVADCTVYNCNPPFNLYPSAIAATRAEARALRKLLRLKTIAAEEIMSVGDAQVPQSEELISKTQISFFDDKCKELDINCVKFLIESIDIIKESSIEKVTKDNASKLIQQLHKYINGETVPTKLKGYKANWRN